MQIASLFARIGLQTDEEKLKSFNTGLKGARTTLIAVGAAVAGVSAAITKVTADALDSAAAFQQFEAETGASAQTLQRWQAVAEQTNSSAEAVSAAVRSIALNQERIRLGEGDISGFQLLGIDPGEDPFEILSQLRTRTEGLSEAMQRNVLGRLGVGAELLQTIQLSQDEFDALANRAFIISPQAIDTLAQTRASLTQAGRGINYLKTQIAVGLAPQLQELSEGVIRFIHENQEVFVQGFQRAFEIIRRFGQAVIDAARFVDMAVRATLGWENALKLAAAAMLLLNASFLLSPIGLFIAGIILLIALLQDLYVYSQGGDSLFGRIMENFPGLEGGLKELIDGFKELGTVIRSLWSGDINSDIQKLIDDWGIWGDILEAIVNSIRFIKEALTGELGERLTGRADVLREEGREGAANALDILGADVRSERFYDALPGFLKADWWGQVFRGEGFENITAEQARGMNQTNNVNITIEGATDPQETGREVERRLRGIFSGTSAQRGLTE